MDISSSFLRQVFVDKGGDVGPLAVAAKTVIVFLAAIIYARMARKRFMAQGSAVDLAMVIVFGATLSRAVNGGATLLSALVAGLVLVILQRIFARFGVRSPRFGHLVKGSFEILVKDGVVDRDMLRYHDISEADLHSELRMNGKTNDTNQVALAVLERSGRISVVRREGAVGV